MCCGQREDHLRARARPGCTGPRLKQGLFSPPLGAVRCLFVIGVNRSEYDLVVNPSAPGFGDSIGAPKIAGGVPPMAVLFPPLAAPARRLLSTRRSTENTGRWARRSRLLAADEHPVDCAAGRPDAVQPTGCDVRDERWLAPCRSVACRPGSTGRRCARRSDDPSSRTDPASSPITRPLLEHTAEAQAILREVFANADGRRVARGPRGLRRSVDRRAAHARSRRRPRERGQRLHPGPHHASGTPFQLTAAPVQFDEVPP